MSLDPKDPNVSQTYSINWHDVLVVDAQRDQDFAIDAVVRPQRGTGFYYECTTAGRTSAHYPTWPRAVGETVNDGSVVWTAQHPDDATLVGIASATWTVPTGITKVSSDESGFFTNIILSSGTDGVDYDILCRMTDTAGKIHERTITVPVRSL